MESASDFKPKAVGKINGRLIKKRRTFERVRHEMKKRIKLIDAKQDHQHHQSPFSHAKQTSAQTIDSAKIYSLEQARKEIGKHRERNGYSDENKSISHSIANCRLPSPLCMQPCRTTPSPPIGPKTSEDNGKNCHYLGDESLHQPANKPPENREKYNNVKPAEVHTNH